MQTVAQDLRYALRQLRRSPGFTLTVLLTLTLAIGATAALSGVLRSTLLAPLPYPQSSQLVEIGDQNLRGFKTNGLLSVARAGDLAALHHDGHPALRSLGFYYFDDVALGAADLQNATVPGTAVSDDFFTTLGVQPLLGRTLGPLDNLPNAPLTIVISQQLWLSAFHGDSAILGRAVRLGPAQGSIVGVMPAGFDLPSGVAEWHAGHISVANFQGYRGDGSRFVVGIARLDPRETLASFRTEGDALAERLRTQFPATDADWGFHVSSLRRSLFGDYRQALLLLSAAVALVLAITAVNIAGLQLSRQANRRQEFAIRAALGVTRARLIRQLLAESTLPVVAGSLLGIAAAALSLHALAAQLPAALVRVSAPRIDWLVIAICCAAALVVGLATGIVPALAYTSGSLTPATTRLPSTRRYGGAFTALQIALSLVLLSFSAAVTQQLYALLHTPLGFKSTQVSTFSVDMPWGVDAGRLHRLYQAVESSAATLPGVSNVGSISALPLSPFSLRRSFDIAGQPITARHDTGVAEGRTLSPGYLRAMAIPLLAGRSLNPRDAAAGAPSVALVNHALAARYFHGRNPVGERLLLPSGVKETLTATEIVGVTGDVHGTGGKLGDTPQPEIDTPEDGGWPHMQFALRSTLPPSVLEPEIQHIVSGLDAAAAVGHFGTVAGTLRQTYAQPRLNAALLSAFAGLSLLLVILGVYGLVAYDVSRRTREFGLRLALGSTRGGLVRLVLGAATRILLAGVALGAAAAWSAARLLSSALSLTQTAQQSTLAPLFLAASALLSLAVVTASLIPARRAASIEPTLALRTE